MKKIIYLMFTLAMSCTLFGCTFLEHEHNFSKEWMYDKQYHWHESECGHDVISGKSEHVFSNGKCDFCGYKFNMNSTNKLSYLSNRYEIYSAPVIDNKLPLIDSSTDFIYNYYLVDGGLIKNVPISSGLTIRYDGVTPITVYYEKSTVTTERIENSMSKTVMESLSETSLGSATFSIELGIEKNIGASIEMIKAEMLQSFKVGTSYSRQWGTITEKQNSVTSVYTVASESAKQLTNAITYTIGEHGEEAGSYRLSLVTMCDIYYLITTNRNNTELIDCTVVFCARNNEQYALEYSDNGDFAKTSDTSLLQFPDSFYKKFEIPTKTVSSIITLDEVDGYKLEQDKYEVTFGKDYELPVPQKYNYAFVGWYTSPNGEGIRYTDHNGKSLTGWSDTNDRILYAHWVSTSTQLKIENIHLGSQECYSNKSNLFSINLDIETLRSIGYKYLQISISGWCSDYDYRMNERGRYFVLSDAIKGDLIYWRFVVEGFSGVDSKNISLDNLNCNGSYQLQLVSDKSDAYNEKLKVNDIIITIIAVR